MQPNQQNQNGQTEVPPQPALSPAEPLPYQVPDYLGLAPIADPVLATQGRRRKRIVLTAFVLLLVIVACLSFWLFWLWQQNRPEEKLRHALELQMQVNYVKRDIDIEKRGDTAKIVADTDVSDPAHAKSDVLTTVDTDKANSSLQTIVLDSKRYSYSIKSATPNVFDSSVSRNQWYNAPFHTANRNEINYRVDDMESPLVLNSAQGLIPIGAFTADQREQLLAYMESHDIYHVLSAQSQTVGGAKLTGYAVQLDLDKINALNEEIVKMLNLPQLFMIQKPYPTYQSVTLWVDESTGRFAKIEYNSGKDKSTVDTKQTTRFTYLDTLLIEAPTGAKELAS